MPKRPSLSFLEQSVSSSGLGAVLRKVGATSEQENRRHTLRRPRSIVLIIQPLNNQFEPVGSPFKAITRDVSETGLGFLHESAFPTSFVRIGVTAASSAQSIAQVCYNKAIYRDGLVYLVGVKFISPNS